MGSTRSHGSPSGWATTPEQIACIERNWRSAEKPCGQDTRILRKPSIILGGSRVAWENTLMRSVFVVRPWRFLCNTLGERHPKYGQSLSYLAVLDVSDRKYAQAEPLFQEAIAIDKEMMGETSGGYARSLSNLAFLYGQMGEYAKAEPAYQKALSILKVPWVKGILTLPSARTSWHRYITPRPNSRKCN